VHAFLQAARSVADIGAGDGALALALAADGRRVIATEAQPGPYRRLVARAGAAVEVRFGWGLEPIRPGEVEMVAVAGMGERTILAILDRARDRLGEWRRIVALPHGDAALLRARLPALGLALDDESLVAQGRRIYQVLALRQGPPGRPLDPVERLVGPLNLARRHPLLPSLVDRYLERWRPGLERRPERRPVVEALERVRAELALRATRGPDGGETSQ
jgi:tRNA (adenine22-N1)-methyltransferase